MAVAGESRTDRRVPHAAPVCDRLMYHVLPDGGIRYDKQHHVARRAGHGKDAGGGNAGHEPIQEQKDKLEYEAMVRNPETAYLVSNEEFDKQLEELGWSPSDMVTMAGMYIDRGMYYNI